MILRSSRTIEPRTHITSILSIPLYKFRLVSTSVYLTAVQLCFFPKLPSLHNHGFFKSAHYCIASSTASSIPCWQEWTRVQTVDTETEGLAVNHHIFDVDGILCEYICLCFSAHQGAGIPLLRSAIMYVTGNVTHNRWVLHMFQSFSQPFWRWFKALWITTKGCEGFLQKTWNLIH